MAPSLSIGRRFMSRPRRPAGGSRRKTGGFLTEPPITLRDPSAAPGGQAHALHPILESLSHGIVVADRSGGILVFNDAARRILGAGPIDVPLDAWTGVFGMFLPDARTPYPHDRLPLARAVRGETVIDAEVFVRNPRIPDGASLILNGTPWKDSAGALHGGIVTLRDVTAERQSRNALEQLSNVVEQTADDVMITDVSGRILYVNPAFERTTGYTRDESCGRTPRLLKSGLQAPPSYTAMWTVLLAGEVFRGTIVNRKRSGQLYSSGQTITPMKNRAGNITHFVSVGRDVTEQERTEEKEIEMRLAGRVQQRLHPPILRCDGIDIAGAAHPANATGGDYYDYLSIPGGEVGIAVADVSGHGFGAALMMVATRAALRSCLQLQLNPDQVLDQVNATLLGDLEPHSFVTMLLARLDVRGRSLTYSSAGHPSGYVLDHSGEIRCVMDSTRIPLGIIADWIACPPRTIPLEEGDILVFLTDGVLESVGADGLAFGVENVLELVRQHRREPAQQILDRLLEGVHASAMGAPQLDDMTAVICKVGGVR